MAGIETRWLHEAIAAFRDETVLYLRTAAAFALRPRRFVADWSAGARRAQNPLGFMATTLAITAALQFARNSLPGATEQADSASPFWRGVLQAAGPYAHYLALGVASHGVLRATGSRGRLLASVAATLYSGGIALLAIATLYFCAALLFPALRPSGNVSRGDAKAFAVALLTFAFCFALFLALLVAALARMHAIRLWRSAVAVALALVASALVFGALRPPGSYGLHPVLQIVHDGGGRWHAAFELSSS
jgi:hypothetical protein